MILHRELLNFGSDLVSFGRDLIVLLYLEKKTKSLESDLFVQKCRELMLERKEDKITRKRPFCPEV